MEGNGNVLVLKKSKCGQECAVMKCLRMLQFLQPSVISLKITYMKKKDVIKSFPYSHQHNYEPGPVQKPPHIFLSSNSKDNLLTSFLRLCLISNCFCITVFCFSSFDMFISVSWS